MQDWILQALNDPYKDAPCSALSCMHRTTGGDVEVHAVKLKAGQQWDPAALATMFREKAEYHVQDMPGQQRFHLLAFYGRAEPQARLPFNVANNSELMNGETEPPTNEGKLAQSMRQSEAGFQFWGRMVNENVRYMTEALESERRHSRDLLHENREAIALVKELVMERSTRAHEFRMKELEFARATDERKLLMRTGGAILNEVTGREIIPQSAADTNLLELLFECVNEEQIKQLTALLPPQVGGPLAARATQYLKQKEAAQSQAMTAVENRNDPVLEE
jgi:hypothetical protein